MPSQCTEISRSGSMLATLGQSARCTLMPRSQPGAISHDVELAARRVVRMATEGKVEAIDGTVIDFRPASVCFHGDTPEAVQMAKAVRKALEEAGVAVRPIKEVVLG